MKSKVVVCLAHLLTTLWQSVETFTSFPALLFPLFSVSRTVSFCCLSMPLTLSNSTISSPGKVTDRFNHHNIGKAGAYVKGTPEVWSIYVSFIIGYQKTKQKHDHEPTPSCPFPRDMRRFVSSTKKTNKGGGGEEKKLIKWIPVLSMPTIFIYIYIHTYTY